MPFLKTPVAAVALGVPYWTLIGLLRYGKIIPPTKDSSGDYVWTEADLDRVRQFIAQRPKRKAQATAVAEVARA